MCMTESKDMIVSGAENVYPAEVENALFGHPAIADVAVIGVPDPRWGEAVKAMVVLRPGHSAMADEIIAHARQRIAGFKVPKSIDFLDVLPRNAGQAVAPGATRAVLERPRSPSGVTRGRLIVRANPSLLANKSGLLRAVASYRSAASGPPEGATNHRQPGASNIPLVWMGS